MTATALRHEEAGAPIARAPSTAAYLEVRDLHAWYGESHVLHGVGFEMREGEVVTLLGRNGAGKTTTLKSIMGIVRKRQGSVRFDGAETVGLASNRIARLGIALCPEERGIFAGLDVKENLMLPPTIARAGCRSSTSSSYSRT
jgi:branched-chain amino acid transport system ATP-binding protein